MSKKPTEEQQHPTQIDDKIDTSILEARRILISGGVDGDLAYEVIRQLWYLEFSTPGKPIILVINSPGGSVDDGFAIWDQIKMITSPVTTLVTGLAASMGSILSLAAAPKRRFSTPNARFMIHQPSIQGLIQGQATDLDIQAQEILKTREKIINIYVEKTGKDYETIKRAIDRDTWMTAEEALKFNHIDKIITSFSEL